MKTYKTLQHLKDRIQSTTDWDDNIIVDGLTYHIEEYGGGSMMKMDYDYVHFHNKRTGKVIQINYHCPAYQYVDGKKIQTQEYKLLSVGTSEQDWCRWTQ